MEFEIEKSWAEKLSAELDSQYFTDLTKTIDIGYSSDTPIYPPRQQIFSAFALCPFTEVKVVILGQDPYHATGQAHGLSFSVPSKTKIPPSLKNIYKELNADLNLPIPTSGNLERWAKQGILLLNATLTVAVGQPGSHQGLGWEIFTDAVIKVISAEKSHVVFLLWGKYAQAKANLIDEEKHLILKSPHPSPFSAHSGFFGSGHFSKTNAYLKHNKQLPIDW